jgi:hypothetical protein
MVTFPSASTKIAPVVIGVTFVFVVVTATPFKVSFPITLPAATGEYLKLMVLLVFLKYRLLQ